MIASEKRQSGFTLIESLIALLVLSVGLLGLVGLQAQGLRFNHDAYLRGQATLLASDIADRIRTYQQTITDQTALNAAMNSFVADQGDHCNLQVADPAAEKSCWQSQVKSLLPDGQSSIQRDQNGTPDPRDDHYIIQLSWHERSANHAVKQIWTVHP